jgi:hypothetical protein
VSWDRPTAVAAVAATLAAAAGETIPVFDHPPATFNVPAIIVSHPETVSYNTPAFGIDLATIAVVCAAGLDDAFTVDQLIHLAITALSPDPMLGGRAVMSVNVSEQRNWRAVNVAGADYLTAELVLEIRM